MQTEKNFKEYKLNMCDNFIWNLTKNMDREFANANRKELQGIKSNFKV